MRPCLSTLLLFYLTIFYIITAIIYKVYATLAEAKRAYLVDFTAIFSICRGLLETKTKGFAFRENRC